MFFYGSRVRFWGFVVPSWRNDINNPLRLYYIFSDEWLERRLKYVWGRNREERQAQIRQAIMQERQDIMNNLLKQPKTWYFDQDGDRYHGQVRQSAKRPGAKWTLYTRGQDCNDTNKHLYKDCSTHTVYRDEDKDKYYKERKEGVYKEQNIRFSNITYIEVSGNTKTVLQGRWNTTSDKGVDCDDTDKDKTTDCTVCEKGKIPDGNGGCKFDPCLNKDLRHKKLPQNILDLINDRKQGVSVPGGSIAANVQSFHLQTIEDGYGDINTDLYVLDIPKLPNGVTIQQLFEDIRRNFTELITGGNLPFTNVNLMPYSEFDRTVWNSNNPIGAAMDFDTLLDTSTVITTEYSLDDTFWTFTTVRSVDHLGHFVSGHRQFRLIDNENGTYSFEIRGADRLGQQIDKIANNMIQIIESDLLFKYAADDTWKNLMETLENFIKQKLGSEVKPFDRDKEYGRRQPYNENDCK